MGFTLDRINDWQVGWRYVSLFQTDLTPQYFSLTIVGFGFTFNWNY